jgi:hypothetical protein
VNAGYPALAGSGIVLDYAVSSPLPPRLGRFGVAALRRWMARSNRCTGVMSSLTSSISRFALGDALIRGAARAGSGVNVWPSGPTGPPQTGHCRPSLLSAIDFPPSPTGTTRQRRGHCAHARFAHGSAGQAGIVNAATAFCPRSLVSSWEGAEPRALRPGRHIGPLAWSAVEHVTARYLRSTSPGDRE